MRVVFHLLMRGVSPRVYLCRLITSPMLCAVAFAALFVVAACQGLSSSSDLAGLYSLRASLGLRARDWPRHADPCSTWVGVRCDSGRVVSLRLSGLRRTRHGRLDPRFSVDGLRRLTQLRDFNASGFALPGPIPDWFGHLLPPSLAVLDLSFAAVVGPIPSSLGGAAELVVLSLAGNAITGDVPPTLGNLRKLSVLDLSHNVLSGSVPTSLAALSNLSYLDMSSNFLFGMVPLALGNLPNLRTLILANNNLTGPVPAKLGDLSSLNVLDLSFNSLAGALPDDLRSLRNLQVLNLHNNLLSGGLTDSLFSGLSQLRTITLSHNKFSSTLPYSIWYLPEVQFLDLSHNNLTGTLPELTPSIANSSAYGFILNLSNNIYYGQIPNGFLILFTKSSSVDISGNYFRGSLLMATRIKNVSFGLNCIVNASNQRSPADCYKFYTNMGLDYGGNATPSGSLSPSSASSGKKGHGNFKYILIGTIGGTLVLGISIILLFCCLRSCRDRITAHREISRTTPCAGGSAQPSGVSVNLSVVREAFTYEQLVRATSEFSEANLIKQGHSGDIYHGTLAGGVHVVVKRMDMQKVRKDAHVAELDLFARGLHERLVPFLGHCLDNANEKFLIYKYVANSDLFTALHRKPSHEDEYLQPLDWIKRLKIATGIAEALYYLHHECTPPLVHRDLQASSILLDHKFEVRLGSLSQVCAQEAEGHQNVITRLLRLSQVPEQGVSGPPATCAYDVHCFGKVLLELVTGNVGISGSNDAATIEWLEHTLLYINVYEKELVRTIVDPFLVVDEDHLEEVWAIAIVAKSCLNPKSSRRPPIRYILKALESPLKVVREDDNSGSARLRATSSRGSWHAALFGSWWGSSSDMTSVSAHPRDAYTLKRSATTRSQGSGGEHSFSHWKPSNEIFPEPPEAQEIGD
ncbi:putative LRR receptor-like serine/threonine-protein kinase [Canna indica]|uniref:LRR receptor-like serine/threonine-protein kinase n=1 Tax=Canna indica TaxID=4628 RepID=A0AAQ3Q0G0_9LILI|nr:putative LRR receptor-like serine/threonine-protein kinase [Canna indica]